MNNGPEFYSKSLNWWALVNALIELSKWTFRGECLNEHRFMSISEAQLEIDSWTEDYNGFRPHSALGGRTPKVFAAMLIRASARMSIAVCCYHPQCIKVGDKVRDLRIL